MREREIQLLPLWAQHSAGSLEETKIYANSSTNTMNNNSTIPWALAVGQA